MSINLFIYVRKRKASKNSIESKRELMFTLMGDIECYPHRVKEINIVILLS